MDRAGCLFCHEPIYRNNVSTPWYHAHNANRRCNASKAVPIAKPGGPQDPPFSLRSF